MKTMKMIANIGICEGYGHSNEIDIEFEDMYMKVAEEVFSETKIYISAISKITRTLYSKNWGCPKGGEVTYEVTSIANPEYITSIEAWKLAVIEVVQRLKKLLKQSTVTVEFMEVDLYYLRD